MALFMTIGILAGCDHSEPFHSSVPAPGGPLTPGAPTRLTYNPERDLQPRWLPDGSGFYYTVERNDRDEPDQCLARMGANGGVIVALVKIW